MLHLKARSILQDSICRIPACPLFNIPHCKDLHVLATIAPDTIDLNKVSKSKEKELDVMTFKTRTELDKEGFGDHFVEIKDHNALIVICKDWLEERLEFLYKYTEPYGSKKMFDAM